MGLGFRGITHEVLDANYLIQSQRLKRPLRLG